MRQFTAEENRAVVSAVYEAFARGDIPAILAILNPKTEWTDAEGFPYIPDRALFHVRPSLFKSLRV